jgi:type I restriction enzyme, S subunit
MGEFESTTLGRLLSFSNGRSSPSRAKGLPYPVYGSNGVIGFAAETNATAETIVIGRVGSYCGSLYFSKDACWVMRRKPLREMAGHGRGAWRAALGSVQLL